MVITIKRGASKKSIRNIWENLVRDIKPKGVNTYAYVGKINLDKDSLEIQKKLRSEWE